MIISIDMIMLVNGGILMAAHVSAVDARRSFGRLLNIVSLTHEEIVIERAGKAIAKLVSYEQPAGTVSGGKQDLRKARGLGRKLWADIDTDAYLRKEREAWD